MTNKLLSEAEEIAIRKLIDNKAMMAALKKVFLYQVYASALEEGKMPEPRRNFVCSMLYDDKMQMDYNLSNERIGEKVRATVEAIRLLEVSFAELENMREVKVEEEKKENGAR